MTTIVVKEEHIVAIGHVNNVTLVSFLETARRDWYIHAGIPYEEMRKRNLGCVIRKMDLSFFKEVRLGDTLSIVSRPQKLGNKSFDLIQQVYNQLQELIIEVKVTSVMFDTIERKSIPVVEEIARNFTLVD